MFSSLRENWRNRRLPVGVTKLTQNSKGHANYWIAYPFINTIHFTINNAFNRSLMCLIKALCPCDAKIKKSPRCCLQRQQVPNILHFGEATNEAK
jgi:hypothetical protein